MLFAGQRLWLTLTGQHFCKRIILDQIFKLLNCLVISVLTSQSLVSLHGAVYSGHAQAKEKAVV